MKIRQDEHSDVETGADDLLALLQVSGELGQHDGDRFASRLAGDASLQARVESLRTLDAILRADAGRPDVSASDSRQALDRSLRLIREQALSVGSRTTGRAGAARRLDFPRWAWGTAVAALLAVGFVLWVISTDPPQQTIARSSPQGEGWTRGMELANAFVSVDPTADQEGSSELEAQIEAQVDALSILATMSGPALYEPGDFAFDRAEQ